MKNLLKFIKNKKQKKNISTKQKLNIKYKRI